MTLQPGDRILVKNSEFKDWVPTEATVMQISIRFPHAEPPIQRHFIKIRLDKHPFPFVVLEPIRDLAFERDDPNYVCEKI